MDDLISRQAMLDGIDKLIKIHFDRTVVLYKARKVAEDLPSIQLETNCSEIPNNWIPCSERLPDKRGDYLVTLRGNGEPWVEIALWNETFGGRWQMVLYNDVDYSDISNVIAWMPLPEAYQEGEQE